MAYGLNISGGSYYGSGSKSTGATIGRTRSASSANFNTMARNVASGYSSDIEIIQSYLEDGKTDKAIQMYESLFEDVKATTDNYNYDLTDAEIKSILKSAYEGSTGSSMVNSIKENTSNSFMTGFKQNIPIIGLFTNDTSEAEAIAELTGQEVFFKDKALEFLGMATATALFWWLGGPIGKGAQLAAKSISNIGFLGKVANALPKTCNVLNWMANNVSGITKAATAVTAGVNIASESAEYIDETTV